MASNSRRQIEAWLKTIDVKGSVIDIGGLFMPVKGRTKSWDVDDYKILDIKHGRHGIKTDIVVDLNYRMFPIKSLFDNAFCVEVTDHFWNPIQAFENINELLNPGARLYISSNFLFPHHTGFDCMRYTKIGLSKILTETGFDILHIEPRFAFNVTAFGDVMRKESKVYYSPGEIGYMIFAQKHGL